MNTLYAIEEVVPHRQDMCLLERITHWDQDTIEAELVVPDAGLFVEEGQVPAAGRHRIHGAGHRGLGRLPCACGRQAAAVGLPAWQPPLQQPAQQLSQRIAAARAERCELLGDNGLGMFACRILAGEDEWATANVSVFEPADAMAYLESGQA